MSNAILDEFFAAAKSHPTWVVDDPKSLIEAILENRERLNDEELTDTEAAWLNATPEEFKEAETFLLNLLVGIPDRPKGELIYLMGFLGDKESGAHVTLLGPTIFEDDDKFGQFVKAVQLQAETTAPIAVKLTDTVYFTENKPVQLVEKTRELDRLHKTLLVLAELGDGKLQEPEFTGKAFNPHVTFTDGGPLTETEFTLTGISISVHPGCRFNVEHAHTWRYPFKN